MTSFTGLTINGDQVVIDPAMPAGSIYLMKMNGKYVGNVQAQDGDLGFTINWQSVMGHAEND